MTIKKFLDERAADYQVNGNWNKAWSFSVLNKIRQTIDRASVDSAGQDDILSEAYVDANGQNNFVNTGNTTALFDTNKYKTTDFDSATSYYVIIEASSISVITDFEINNCLMFANQGETAWLLFADEGDVEVSKAQVMKTLFYGTDGTDARAEATYMTSPTSFKSSASDDSGKRAHYATLSVSAGSHANTFTGTFADTSTNTDCNTWSNVSTTGANGANSADWEIPSGSVRNSVSGSGSFSNDEIGIDTTVDDQSNPADCQLDGTWWAGTQIIKSVILCKGDISWVEVGTSPTTSNIDFNVDNSIPNFTDGSGEDLTVFLQIIEHSIPAGTYPATVSKLIGKSLYEDWESGVNIQHRLENATENSGWVDDGELGTFTAFTSEPTKYLVKLIPKSSSPTANYPSIRGSGMYTE